MTSVIDLALYEGYILDVRESLLREINNPDFVFRIHILRAY
jgi:hypothetical protein